MGSSRPAAPRGRGAPARPVVRRPHRGPNRRCSALIALLTSTLLCLAGCAVPEPDAWTFHGSTLLRASDDLDALESAWRDAVGTTGVRTNVPADSSCYLHLERAEVQDDVVCGPMRRDGETSTRWQQALITSFYRDDGDDGGAALSLGGDGAFHDVDPRRAGALRAADGTEPDLDAEVGPPQGRELAAGESVEVAPRTVRGSTDGVCLMIASALCTMPSGPDSGRRMLELAGREVLVVFQDVEDTDYRAEPYDAAPGTHLMAITVLNTRLDAGNDGADGTEGSDPQGSSVLDVLEKGTEGALGGAEKGSLTASLAVDGIVGAEETDLGKLPESAVTREDVDDAALGEGGVADEEPEGALVRLVAVPDTPDGAADAGDTADDGAAGDEGAEVTVTVRDDAHEATFRSLHPDSATTVPTTLPLAFMISAPEEKELVPELSLGLGGTLRIGGRTAAGDVPIGLAATLTHVGSSGREIPWNAGDDGALEPISYTPKGGGTARYVPSLALEDARVSIDGTRIPLEGQGAEGAVVRAGTTLHSGDPGIERPGARGDDGMIVRGTVVLHLELSDVQDSRVPADQPREVMLEKTFADEDSAPLRLGLATVYGW